jgi:hypothetical protein
VKYNLIRLVIIPIFLLTTNGTFAYEASDDNTSSDNNQTKNVAIGNNANAKGNAPYPATAIAANAHATSTNTVA